MVDRTGLRPTTDGSAGSEQAALEDMNKNYHKQQHIVPHTTPPQPAPEPPKPEPPKTSKPSQKSPSTPSYIKQYNPDHNEFEPAFTIEDSKEEVENTTDSTEKFFANVIEEAVTTSYEAVGTGVINLTRGAHFKSYIDDLLKIKGAAFNAMGIGIDFIGELKDGNGVLGAAILAAGHFATTAVINMVLSATFIWLGIPSIFIIPATIIISSIIITYVDSRYMA